MSDELAAKIDTVAQGPKSVRTDAGEVVSQSLAEMIEADKYLAARSATAATNTHRGLRFNTLKPPGSV
jgi:hypothetical protein